MNANIRFGVLTSPSVPWEQMVERWQTIEALGFDSVWLPDHFVNLRQPRTPQFEAWTLLPALATQTTRIRIGTLMSAIPFRNPAFLARQALTVDHLSQGRLELGLGTGASGKIDASYAMTGIDDWSFSERVARFQEVVEIVDQLLCNEVSSYQGRFYQLKDTAMLPRPIQQPRPPITIAAHGPKMLKIAASHGDAWSSMGGFNLSPEELLAVTCQRNSTLDEHCVEAGRDPSTLRRSLLLWPPIREMVYQSVDAFMDIVAPYIEGGIDEFVLAYPSKDEQLPIFERIASEGISKLRG
jgi:alkanesulfonate monooxygenase SsuD/methylene tetrahydromethanopterin reductase-like flavin-dependent oxidoreductase (luciferase family)